MSIVEQYFKGLLEVLPQASRDELSLAAGATTQQIQALQDAYPHCPLSLLELLGKANGTHWQKYEKGEVSVLVLGSDMAEYPYYLRSIEQILEDRQNNDESIAQIYGDYLEENPELVDSNIDPELKMGERLCFAYCMNNGGTSQLFIDFAPLGNGTVGQVIRFLHDPDEYVVIADSFDTYLKMLIDDGYGFILEEE